MIFIFAEVGMLSEGAGESNSSPGTPATTTADTGGRVMSPSTRSVYHEQQLLESEALLDPSTDSEESDIEPEEIILNSSIDEEFVKTEVDPAAARAAVKKFLGTSVAESTR